jgi:imidazolonepropionase-like amidohydrolase
MTKYWLAAMTAAGGHRQMRSGLRLRLLLPLCLGLLGGFSSAQVTAIRAGAVIDPDAGTAGGPQVILIEGGNIKAMGTDLAIPADAAVIDLSAQFVLPGLIDAHTHLLAQIDAKWDLGDFWIMALQRRAGFRAILGAQHAREMLEAGFTTVRDVGNSGDYLDMDLEKSIRFGLVPGPTMIAAGRIIAPFGGQFWDTPTDGKLLENAEYSFADSHDELRKAIRQNIYWGAKVIKIVVDAKSYQYSVDDIRFVVAEAGGAGLKVAAHVQTERGARAAIEARVASIEHAWEITDDDLALARKNHVVLVSTDFTVRELMADGMSEDAAARIHAARVERLRRAYRAGVTIVFGTDIMSDVRGTSRGALAMEYTGSFVEAGVPPPAILRAMTVNAAQLLGVDKERGALRPGQAADIIAVASNPLQDISCLQHVDFVMRNGRIYVQSLTPHTP